MNRHSLLSPPLPTYLAISVDAVTCAKSKTNDFKKLDCNKLQPLHLTYIALVLDKVI